MKQEELEEIIVKNKEVAEVVRQAFDMGWNAALFSAATAMDNMKALGDTAASFAAFVRDMKK